MVCPELSSCWKPPTNYADYELEAGAGPIIAALRNSDLQRLAGDYRWPATVGAVTNDSCCRAHLGTLLSGVRQIFTEETTMAAQPIPPPAPGQTKRCAQPKPRRQTAFSHSSGRFNPLRLRSFGNVGCGLRESHLPSSSSYCWRSIPDRH